MFFPSKETSVTCLSVKFGVFEKKGDFNPHLQRLIVYKMYIALTPVFLGIDPISPTALRFFSGFEKLFLLGFLSLICVISSIIFVGFCWGSITHLRTIY